MLGKTHKKLLIINGLLGKIGEMNMQTTDHGIVAVRKDGTIAKEPIHEYLANPIAVRVPTSTYPLYPPLTAQETSERKWDQACDKFWAALKNHKATQKVVCPFCEAAYLRFCCKDITYNLAGLNVTVSGVEGQFCWGCGQGVFGLKAAQKISKALAFAQQLHETTK